MGLVVNRVVVVGSSDRVSRRVETASAWVVFVLVLPKNGLGNNRRRLSVMGRLVTCEDRLHRMRRVALARETSASFPVD